MILRRPLLSNGPTLATVMQLSRSSSRASRSCIRSVSSSTHSQTSLSTVNVARYGPRVVNRDVFTCEGAVDAHRLLSLVRKDICQLARRHGWNALTEEQWECTILTKPRPGKRTRYVVKVCYEAIIARSSEQSLECCPVELEAAKGVDGVMTVLSRDAKQKVTGSNSPVIDWWGRLSQPWSCGAGYITIM